MGRGVLLQQLLVPPVVGVSLGALVGMLGRGLVLPPEVAPLGWLFMAISKLGAAAVPINLILLGAALSQGPLRGELPRLNSFGVVLARLVYACTRLCTQSATARTQPATARTQPATARTQPATARTQPAAPCTQPAAPCTQARLVLMPLCGLAVARFLASHISVPAEVADPFWLVCLIVTCTPTGNNIVVLCELAGDNKVCPATRARALAPCAPRCIALPCATLQCVPRCACSPLGLFPTRILVFSRAT